MLFDTAFFIDWDREVQAGVPGPATGFYLAHRRWPREASVVTMGEFAVGATRAQLRATFRGFRPLALGRELAIFAGHLQAALPFEMGENDLWIAATALRHGLPLVSRDRAFARVPGLRVLVY